MFKAWPKIPRLENEIYHITEKIDGTNACIVIQPCYFENLNKDEQPLYYSGGIGIWAQSRTRLITPEDDNFGFAAWVQNNAKTLIKDLGVGYHYGEWWGKGINRGYDLDHKRFSLFNPIKQSSVCYNVPMIKSLTEDEFFNTTWKEQFIEEFKEFGSLAVSGYMNPEGLVVYAEKAKTSWKVIIDE